MSNELFKYYFEEIPAAHARFYAYLFDRILFRELPTNDYMELKKIISDYPVATAEHIIRKFYKD